MGIKATATFPVLHVGSIPELLCKVVDAILPLVKDHAAKSATRLDVLRFRLPSLHACGHLAAMHQPQVLSKMVFPVKGSRFGSLFVTSSVVVSRQMLTAGIQLVAVDAFGLSSSLVSDNLSQRCAQPLLKG